MQPARTLFMAALATFIVSGAFYLDYLVIISILTSPNDRASTSTLLGTIIGVWNGAGLGVVVGFYFGRSSDSDRKTDIIAASTPPVATSTTVTPGMTTTESTPAEPTLPTAP
jgi:hypothetical protein